MALVFPILISPAFVLIFTHPTGNANVRHAALGLFRAGLLGEFWTCLNLSPPSLLARMLPARVIGQLSRRAYPSELAAKIRTRPFHEAVRHFAPRLGLGGLTAHETGPFCIDAVYRALDRAVARRIHDAKFTAVYAYEDGARLSFVEARRRGIRTLYDLPIGHWRAARTLLLDEADREPEWAATLSGNRDSPSKTERKDAELSLADVVFVASTFTRRTLTEAADFKGAVMIVPYGAPSCIPLSAEPAPQSAAPKKLRVLFVGSLGQRKGLSYLFAACRLVRSAVTLTIIGRKPEEPCPVLDRELAAVRWIPSCPHREILTEMAAHDVFVFPSLFEGFGLVLLEALAMGLPIITTPNTAGPDIIAEGVEGFIVPIRDSAAIAARLELLHREPARLAEMSRMARLRSAEYSWDNYEQTLAACVGRALA